MFSFGSNLMEIEITRKKTARAFDANAIRKMSSHKVMTTDEILKQLARFDRNNFPHDALLAAAAHKEELVPELLAALDRVSTNPAAFIEDHDSMLHVFALYLLAEWRETRALEPILRLFSLPDEQPHDLTGDVITSDGAQILAAVCDRHVEPLLRLATNESINEYVRGQALEALGVLAAWGERSKAEIIEVLRSLFQDGLKRPGDAYVWAEWAGVVMDLNAQALLPELREAFDLYLVDETVITLDYIEKCFQQEGEDLVEAFAETHRPVSAMEIAGWAAYTETEYQPPPIRRELVVGELGAPLYYESSEPYTAPVYSPPVPYVAPPKTGRNDACPCGSGKKFKKCCGKN